MPLDQDQDDAKIWSSRGRGDVSMPLGDHLEELRRRVVLSLAGVVAVAVVTFVFGFRLIGWIAQPLLQAMDILGFPPQTYITEPTAGFTSVYLPVTLIAAVILASPWVLYQLWKFVAVGLYSHERHAVYLLVPFSTVMVAAGVAFTYYVLLPVSLMFFLNFATLYPKVEIEEPGPLMELFRRAYGAPAHTVDGAAESVPGELDSNGVPPRLPVMDEAPDPLPEGGMWVDRGTRKVKVVVDGAIYELVLSSSRLINPLPKLDEFIRFAAFMGLGVVGAFQLPVVMLVAGWTGLFDPALLAKGRKFAVFFAAVVGAVLTPTDVFSMIVLSVPLYALFEFGLVMMRWADRRRDVSMDDTVGADEG